jgi:hypothetical protein
MAAGMRKITFSLLVLAILCSSEAFTVSRTYFKHSKPGFSKQNRALNGMFLNRQSVPAACRKCKTARPQMSLEVQSLASAESVSMLMAFADQGSNLAGKFFQASLLPYLGFLFFLKSNGKQTPAMSFFGFQFLLLFVLATIPTGIISKSIYGQSLADVDWLHGAAEALLTVTNLLIVSGFRDAMSTGDASRENSILKGAAIATAAAVAVFAAVGQPILGLEAHAAFLGGIG